MKQTAVEWLVDRFVESGIDFLSEEIEFINQAKEIEKQQQGYSEEEFKTIINDIVEKHCTYFEQKLKDDVKLEWFEQFKKK